MESIAGHITGLIITFVLIGGFAEGAAGAGLPCKAEGKTCQALVSYVTQQTTNLSTIASLFQLDDYRSLLGANAWELSLPASTALPGGYIVRVPITCACNHGRGVSAGRKPIYTVKKDDDYLYFIATTVFAGLLKYPEIAEVNGIPDPNKIENGQKLYIPLPCSCAESDAQNHSSSVLHYTYVVQGGDTMEHIASSLEASAAEIVAVNGIVNASLLYAGQRMDVPLDACSLGMSTSSSNNGLLIAKGSYATTAGNCVQCSCGPKELELYCAQASLGASCSNMRCKNSNLMIGNDTQQQTSVGCNVTTCSYTGYNKHTILTSLTSVIQSKCPGKRVLPVVTTPSSTLVPPPPPMMSSMPPPPPTIITSSPKTPSPPPNTSPPSPSRAIRNIHQVFQSILILGLLIDGLFAW